MPRTSGKGYKQRPLRRYGFFIAVAGLLALLLLQTSPRLSEGDEPIRTAASDQLFHVTRPSLMDQISGASAKDRKILQLEARVRELAQYKALALTMAERLEVYEEILNMQGEPGGAEVTARIMAETNGPFAEALLANAGATNGVSEGYYAENDRGLVGRVVQVGQRSSRILKVTDFNSRVPVMGAASGLRAIGGDCKDIRVDRAMLTGQLSYVRLKPTITIDPPEAAPIETELSVLAEDDPS